MRLTEEKLLFPKILWIAIILYSLIFILITAWKFYIGGYNALDLGILNQVFYNTSLGNFFKLTIHPPSYLGDHFALFILLLTPFYLIFKNPLTLLVLQTFFLAFSTWPLYLIAREKLTPKLSLLICIIFLFNPFIQNINLFEFHFLPFAIFLLLFTFYFYQKRNYSLFIIFTFLSLLIREDLSLIIFMFGILALIEKRNWKWIVFPILVSFFWVILAFKIIGEFRSLGDYKFIVYYSWLGNSYPEIIKNFFLQPFLVLKHLFNLNNLVLILGIFLPLLGLPLLRPKYLLLSLLIFLQLFFANFSGELILKTHYGSLLIPFLFVSLIYSLSFLVQIKEAGNFIQNKIKNLIFKEKTLFLAIFLVVITYSALTIGPLSFTFSKIFVKKPSYQIVKLKNNLVKLIPQSSSVATTYEFLTKLSSREKIYSLNYAFLGRQQYAQESQSYTLPQDTQYLLFDFQDLVTYQIQYENSKIYPGAYLEGDNNLRQIIEEGNYGIKELIDNYVLFEKNQTSEIQLYEKINPPYSIKNKQEINLDNQIKFLGWEKNDLNSKIIVPDYQILPLSFFWQAQKSLDKNWQLKLEFEDQNSQIIYQKIYPLAYGLYPTTEWQTGEIIKTNYNFLIPDEILSKATRLNLSLVKPEGYLTLDGIRSAQRKIVSQELLGQKINLDYKTL